MMADKVLTHWNSTHSALWGHQPIKLLHRLNQSPLFSTEARLIARYPQDTAGPGKIINLPKAA